MSETMCCTLGEYDGERPEFYSDKMVKGRKEHKCCECFETIPKGTVHHRITGKWEGDIDTFRTCPRCKAIRDDHSSGGGYTLGTMWEEIEECWGEDYLLVGNPRRKIES